MEVIPLPIKDEKKALEARATIKNISDDRIEAICTQILDYMPPKGILSKEDYIYAVYQYIYHSKKQIPYDIDKKRHQCKAKLEELDKDYSQMLSYGDPYYRWIRINEGNMGPISFRFYLSPDPKNMHEIVTVITQIFAERNIPVRFKFQEPFKYQDCDRIIVYSDYENRDEIQKVLNEVYRRKSNLFKDSERPINWVYDSETPNVYIEPETPGTSYGIAFADSLVQCRDILDFMYEGLHDTPEVREQKMTTLRQLVPSLLLRNGLLLNNNNDPIHMNSNSNSEFLSIETYYDTVNGELVNYDYGSGRESRFTPNDAGKIAFRKFFYGIPRCSIPGMKIIEPYQR